MNKSSHQDPEAVDAVREARADLMRLAYRMLGSVADAEDVVQEASIRFLKQDSESVQHPKAWMKRVASRLCIDRLRALKREREKYIGPWLPDPLVQANENEPAFIESLQAAEDHHPDARLLKYDSLSTAFLTVLEQLSPAERSAFLLHDVFDYPFTEVAELMGKSSLSVRQLASRARKHLKESRPRYDLSREEAGPRIDEFLEVMISGDRARIEALLSSDVECWSDGGGKAVAARRVICGADHVSRFLAGIFSQDPARFPAMSLTTPRVNGAPAYALWLDDKPVTLTTAHVDPDGLISHVFTYRNPDKLRDVPDESRIRIR